MTNNEIYAELVAKEVENRNQIEKLENDIKQADYLTLRAEFANYKQEQQKIIESSKDFGKQEVIAALIDFIEKFDELVSLDANDKKFSKKLEKFSNEIQKCIKAIGLLEIDCDTKLDPNVHYAVMMDNNPEFEEDYITEVLQKGYKIDEVLVRPAMVKVNKI